MSTKAKNKNGKRQRNSRSNGRRSLNRRPDRPRILCAMCGERITDISSALAQPPDGAAVHFGCVLKLMEEQMNPSTEEKVIYLGKGSFAVVDENEYNKRRLKIIRRLDWEKSDQEGTTVEWRKNLKTKL